MKKTNFLRIYGLSKRTMAILLSGTLIFVPGCQSQYKNKYVAENKLPDEKCLKSSFENTYDEFNGINKFYSQYIRLFYDSETGVKRIYSYYEGKDGNYLYTLPDGELEMIYYLSDFNNHYWDPEHAQYIKDHSVNLSEDGLFQYVDVEDVVINDSYSLEELNKLLDLYVKGVDANDKAKADVQKIKK